MLKEKRGDLDCMCGHPHTTKTSACRGLTVHPPPEGCSWVAFNGALLRAMDDDALHVVPREEWIELFVKSGATVDECECKAVRVVDEAEG